MKKTIIFALLAFSVTTTSYTGRGVSGPDDESVTFILVRHAEKMNDSENPGLTQEGIERAEYLRYMLSEANIDAVYTTDYNRTRSTVQAVSEMADVPLMIYDPVPEDEIVEQWIKSHNGETVLVSGHSNTIPGIANQLLLSEHFATSFDESDYGNLLIITITGSKRSLLHFKY